MGRSKLKKKVLTRRLEEEPVNVEIPIPNLPKKFLWMHVRSGTKIKNVLGYALKEFSNYESIVWTSAGQGIGKAISCAELFKRKHEELHQITKLRYVESKKSKEEDKNVKVAPRRVPEIHILLSKEIKDVTEFGYQAPGDQGKFSEGEAESKSTNGVEQPSGSNVTCIDAEEFVAMGLRIGQKRPKREQQPEAPLKKSKKKGNADR